MCWSSEQSGETQGTGKEGEHEGYFEELKGSSTASCGGDPALSGTKGQFIHRSIYEECFQAIDCLSGTAEARALELAFYIELFLL